MVFVRFIETFLTPFSLLENKLKLMYLLNEQSRAHNDTINPCKITLNNVFSDKHTLIDFC